MGYKLAGFEVVGANDIDPEMAAIYKANHNPSMYYLKPIDELVKQFQVEGVPDELKGLDILDGSPPCSSFSLAGARDKHWGEKKVFREGQAAQVLDDLFFTYLDLLELLKPRTFIAENVVGILSGKAKGYTKAIVQRAREIGYRVQVFKVDAVSCGVPQHRVRVFFVGTREEKPELVFRPNRPPVCFSDATSDLINDDIDIKKARITPGTVVHHYWEKAKPGQPLNVVHPKNQLFNYKKMPDKGPILTLTATAGTMLHNKEPRSLTWKEYIRAGSFPDDFNFNVAKRERKNMIANYVIGMSVPPFMIRDLSHAVYQQWLS